MKCIVTGGAGFIGSHLTDRLLAEGHEVLAIDNFAAGRPENIAHHKNNPRFSLARTDITELETIKPLFAGAETVFHLAALADIVPSIVDPVRYYRANVCGTMCVLEAARHAGARRLLYAASSSCYGMPEIIPTPETEETCPQYPYALTKYLGEQTVLHWGRVYGLETIALRLFNVYGTRSRTSGTYGAVFGVFLAQKLNGQPLTIVGDGAQTRDFTYVTDVADAFCRAAQSDLRHVVMNVGSGSTYSVNRLAELLGGPTVHIPKRPGEPDCTFADISKIRRLLKWEPKVSFETGVKTVLENIEYWREAPLWTPEKIAAATAEWFKYLK